MYCSKCGMQAAEGATFCSACGQPVAGLGAAPSTTPSPAPGPPGWQAAAARPGVAYAGFWLRFVAYIIDSIILGFVIGIAIFIPLMGSELGSFSGESPWELYTTFGPRLVAIRLLGLMVAWLYFALLESSAWQATLGKKALGLQVTDLAGRRITFGRASGRFFGKIVSAMILLIGFLMAGFTEKKQALHDMMAGCLVIRQM
jgi:uncharacterized RDD family membrane protein YckC